MAHAQKMRLKKSFDFLNHFFISFKEGLEARKKDKMDNIFVDVSFVR